MRNFSLNDTNGKYRKSIILLKKAGFETLEDLCMIDISQLSNLSSIPKPKLKKILLSAEFQSYNIPPDISDMLADSGVIARASELISFDAEDIKALLTKGAKPGEAPEMSIDDIEKMKAQVPRLTLSQDFSKVVALEDEVPPLHYETISALISEEPVVPMREFDSFVKSLEEIYRLFQKRVKALASKPAKPIEFSNIQSLVNSLQEDVKSASTRIQSKIEPSLEITQFESEATPLIDERLKPEVQIKDLSNKIATLQDQLTALKMQRFIIDEDLSPTSAEEEEPPAPRGEELDLSE